MPGNHVWCNLGLEKSSDDDESIIKGMVRTKVGDRKENRMKSV
jgi:hypothetical protein